MAYFEMFERDIGRFADAYARTDVMGLGSGALAGVPYPIDREMVARELEFSAISANSIDAVSDRDFIAEYLAAASIGMMHVSRLAEDIVTLDAATVDRNRLGRRQTDRFPGCQIEAGSVHVALDLAVADIAFRERYLGVRAFVRNRVEGAVAVDDR